MKKRYPGSWRPITSSRTEIENHRGRSDILSCLLWFRERKRRLEYWISGRMVWTEWMFLGKWSSRKYIHYNLWWRTISIWWRMQEFKSSGWTVCRLHIRWKNKKIKWGNRWMGRLGWLSPVAQFWSEIKNVLDRFKLNCIIVYNDTNSSR